MPKFPTRNKVNYASQMLYTSFDATGCHFTNHTGDPLDQFRNTHWTEVNGGNQVRQLHRVQAVNHSFQTNFVDINEYGQLARRDKTYLQTPDVTIDFEYCLADGYNEQVAGFVIDGSNPALMRHINYENRSQSVCVYRSVTKTDGRFYRLGLTRLLSGDRTGRAFR